MDNRAPAGFEPAIAASEQPQTLALDRTATGIHSSQYRPKYETSLLFSVTTSLHAANSSACQEITHTFCNPTVHYNVDKRPPFLSNLISITHM